MPLTDAELVSLEEYFRELLAGTELKLKIVPDVKESEPERQGDVALGYLSGTASQIVGGVEELLNTESLPGTLEDVLPFADPPIKLKLKLPALPLAPGESGPPPCLIPSNS